jgi:hypothetical protein
MNEDWVEKIDVATPDNIANFLQSIFPKIILVSLNTFPLEFIGICHLRVIYNTI